MSDPSKNIQVDLASTVPAYRQIADSVRALLVAGEFNAGEQLPTVRELGMDLGIHHNTVAEAYRILSDEGWLDLGRRRGATVIDRKTPKATEQEKVRFSQRLRELVAEARGSGISWNFIKDELLTIAKQG